MSEYEALSEAVRKNVFKEYKALNRRLNEKTARSNPKEDEKTQKKEYYSVARKQILQWIIECVKHDPESGDYSDDDNDKLIIEAGKSLYLHEGMRGMHDPLVWAFIPKRYHRTIDALWDGIGEWRD